MGDGTASRAAGVRLKNVRGSGLRCVITGRTDTFSFWPSETSENLEFSWRNCKALSLSARASPLRVLGFLRTSALRRWSWSVSRPYNDSYDSSARPMGVASQNSTLPCAIATFPVSLPLSSPGDVWPRLPLLTSTRP